MVQPKDKRRKQKKRVARKPKGGAPLPKSVQSLLKYLSGSGTGIGISQAPTAVQQFQAAAPPLPPQPAGVPKPRAPRVKKVAATAPVPSPLQGIVPQASTTTIIQVPASAPTQEKAESEKQIATLKATTKQQKEEIEKLNLAMTQQGAGILNADLFAGIKEQIQQLEQLPRPPTLRTSQAPSFSGGTPSFAGRSSMRGSERVGEVTFEAPRRGGASVMQSEQSAGSLLEGESSGLGEFLGSEYVKSVSAPVIPEKRMGPGRRPKSEEEKKATRQAAAQRRKEARQLQQEQTRAQALGQLSGLGTSAQSVSSGSSVKAVRGKAQEIFSQAQQAGADPSSTIRAMVAGGGAAALPQAGGGVSLGELKKKPRSGLKIKIKEKKE
jgi:hypothetical protein